MDAFESVEFWQLTVAVLCVVVVVALLRVRSLRQALYKAQRHYPSGLPVRSLAKERLEHAARAAVANSEKRRVGNAEWYAAIVLDITAFKSRINDPFGQAAGDKVIAAVGREIQRQLQRPGDEAFSWGGDEFLVILRATRKDGADRVAERILRAVYRLEVAVAKHRVIRRVQLRYRCGERHGRDGLCAYEELLEEIGQVKEEDSSR